MLLFYELLGYTVREIDVTNLYRSETRDLIKYNIYIINKKSRI